MYIVGRTHQKLGRLILQVHDGLEELKFLRSFRDLKIMYQNVAYLLPRMIGTLDRFTTVPPSLQIEPTNCCNARCICCSTARSSRLRGYMDFDLFQRIIDDAAQVGVKRVHLYLHGEPLLHPRIVEMISYIKLRNLAVHLTTNGMLLDKEKAEAILCSGVNSADHIIFSILGGSKEVHERIMKKVNHDMVMANISDFMQSRTRLGVNGPVIETMFYTMPENEHEEEQYLKCWRGKVDHARLGGRISESFARHKGITIEPRKQTCKNLWERMTIFWNGDATLCCQDVDGDWLLGNLNYNSIREIWNCERLLSIKKIHRGRRFQEFPFCYKCDM
jgi:sulfatase maturation enzyme AslB (radical SAM superfamily)